MPTIFDAIEAQFDDMVYGIGPEDLRKMIDLFRAAEAVVEAARKDKMDDWGFDDEHPWQDSRHKMADDTVKFFEALAAYDKLKGGDA